jgi:hypothetical protein
MRKTTMTAFWVFVHITAWIGILTPALFAFKTEHHGKITREVLREEGLTRYIGGHTLKFQNVAINQIIFANQGQDSGLAPCLFHRDPSPPFKDSANHFDSGI